MSSNYQGIALLKLLSLWPFDSCILHLPQRITQDGHGPSQISRDSGWNYGKYLSKADIVHGGTQIMKNQAQSTRGIKGMAVDTGNGGGWNIIAWNGIVVPSVSKTTM